MSGTGVNGVSNLFTQGGTPDIGAGIAKPNQGSAASFDKIMDKASTGNTQNYQVKDNNNLQITDRKSAADAGYDRYQYRDNGIREGSGEQGRDMDRIAEKLDTYADDAKNVLKENLGVTDEEIESAMASLGLTMADLQNPAQLANLVAELTGCSDVSELLCNGEFLQIIQDIQTLGTALFEELGISMDELQQLYEALAKQSLDDQKQGNQDQKVTDDDFAENAFETVSDMEQPGTDKMTDAKTTFITEAAKNNAEGKVADEEGKSLGNVEEEQLLSEVITNSDGELQHDTGDSEEASYAETNAEALGKKTASMTEDKHFSIQGQEDNHTGAGNVVEQKLTDAWKANGNQPIASYTGQVDTADVIRQIVDAAKVTVAKAETTMEMQLNPEHLGKIYLEVTSKEGGITARIMAQDEAVKAALELHVTELKQSMEQTGIKVEAVEVTVGSHEFERNLEQNAGQQERQAEEQAKAHGQTRKINLNDLDELNGIMSEEEMLVAQMMADSGNSVDFTA